MMVSIPQSGYVPGEEIKVRAQVTNNSRIAHYEMLFMLRKIIKYHAQTPYEKTKTETVIIQERKTSGVMKAEYGTYDTSLLIPAVPPSNLTLCKVMHISYEIKVEAKISTLHGSPKVKIPITIGTIPFNQHGGGAGNPPFGFISDPSTTTTTGTWSLNVISPSENQQTISQPVANTNESNMLSTMLPNFPDIRKLYSVILLS